MSAAAWWVVALVVVALVVVALVVVAVLALLGLAWAGASERRTRAEQDETDLIEHWDHITHTGDYPLDAGAARIDQIHAINREHRTVQPWPQPQTPSDLDHVRHAPHRPAPPQPDVRRRPTHAHVEVDYWALPELGEGVYEAVPVSPAPVSWTSRPARHDGTQRWVGPEYNVLAVALNEATSAWQLVGAA